MDYDTIKNFFTWQRPPNACSSWLSVTMYDLICLLIIINDVVCINNFLFLLSLPFPGIIRETQGNSSQAL